MPSVKLIIRAIFIALALLGGVASTALADGDSQTPDPATVPDPQPTVPAPDPQPTVTATVAAVDNAAPLDPSDPGLPPD